MSRASAEAAEFNPIEFFDSARKGAWSLESNIAPTHESFHTEGKIEEITDDGDRTDVYRRKFYPNPPLDNLSSDGNLGDLGKQMHEQILDTTPKSVTDWHTQLDKQLPKIDQKSATIAFDQLGSPDLTVDTPAGSDPEVVSVRTTAEGTRVEAFGYTDAGKGVRSLDNNMGTTSDNPKHTTKYVTDRSELRRRILHRAFGDTKDFPDVVRESGSIDSVKLIEAINRLEANGHVLEARFRASDVGISVTETDALQAANTEGAKLFKENQNYPDRLKDGEKPVELATNASAQFQADATRNKGSGESASTIKKSGDQDLYTEQGQTAKQGSVDAQIGKNPTLSTSWSEDPAVAGSSAAETDQALKAKRDARNTRPGPGSDTRAALLWDFMELNNELGGLNTTERAGVRRSNFPTHGEVFDDCYDIQVNGKVTNIRGLIDLMEDPLKTQWNNVVNGIAGEEHILGTVKSVLKDENPKLFNPWAMDAKGGFLDSGFANFADFKAAVDASLSEEGSSVSITKKEGEALANAKKYPDNIKRRSRHLQRNRFKQYAAERGHAELNDEGREEKREQKPDTSGDNVDDTSSSLRKQAKTFLYETGGMMYSFFEKMAKYLLYFLLSELTVATLVAGLNQLTGAIVDTQNGCWLAYQNDTGTDFLWKCKVRPLTCDKGASRRPSPGSFTKKDGDSASFMGSTDAFTNFVDITGGLLKAGGEVTGFLADPPVHYIPCEICGAGGTVAGHHGMRDSFGTNEQQEELIDTNGGSSARVGKTLREPEYNVIWYPLWAPVPGNKKSVGQTYPDRRLDNSKNKRYSWEEGDDPKFVDDENNPLDSNDVSCHHRPNTMPLFHLLPNAEGAKEAGDNCDEDAVKPTRSPFNGPVTGYNNGIPQFNDLKDYNGPFPGTDVAEDDECRLISNDGHGSQQTPTENVDDCLTAAKTFYAPGLKPQVSRTVVSFDDSDTAGDPPIEFNAYYDKIQAHTSNAGKFGASECFKNLVKLNNQFNRKLCTKPNEGHWCSQYCKKENWPGIADDPRYKMVCIQNNTFQALNAMLGGILDPLLGLGKAFNAGYLVYVAYFIAIIVTLHFVHSLVAYASGN